jgi:large subunit ribosomal protein L32
MAVPKQRHTKSRRDRRRMHIYAESPHLIKCPKCGKAVLPHVMCWHCGYYKGREIINVLGSLEKKEKKKRKKEIEAEEKTKKEPESLEELSKK